LLLEHPDEPVISELFLSELKPKLTSHCGKKHAVQKMGDVQGLPMHAIVFRSGWDMKNLHTIFDYIVKSMINDERCGKALAGWRMKYGDTYFGGYPPELLEITDEPERVQDLTDLLLGHQSDVPAEVKNLLIASLLRFHSNFLDLLNKEPCSKFVDINVHPFAYHVEEAKRSAGVTDEVFQKWQDSIKKGFTIKNFAALSIERTQGMQRGEFGDVFVDPRSLLDVTNQMASSLDTQRLQVIALENSNRGLARELHEMRKDVCRLTQTIEQLMNFMRHLYLGAEGES
jgi:hypothetical protein